LDEIYYKPTILVSATIKPNSIPKRLLSRLIKAQYIATGLASFDEYLSISIKRRTREKKQRRS